MASPIGLSGTQSFANLSKALKAAGGNIRKEYLADIRKATASAKTVIPDSARKTLPRRGGLNETVAQALKVTSRTSLSGPEATVKIIAVDPPHHDIGAMNEGKLRHPVYAAGDRKEWHWAKKTQPVPPGFFTNPCVAMAPEARRQIAAGTNRMLAQIARATL